MPKKTSRGTAFINKRGVWAALFFLGVAWALGQSELFLSEVLNLGGWTVVARLLEAFTHPELSLEACKNNFPF